MYVRQPEGDPFTLKIKIICYVVSGICLACRFSNDETYVKEEA